jgi:import inner membrane translocase subunit TIM50
MKTTVVRPGQTFEASELQKEVIVDPAVQPMHSTLLSCTARRLATAPPPAHLSRTFSVSSGRKFPKNPRQAASNPTPRSQASENTHTPTRSPISTQKTPVDTQNVPGSDSLAAPTPTTLSLDFAPAEPGAERERTGAKSSKDSLSSIERRRRQLGRVSFGLFALGLLSGGVYLGREWTEDELVSRRSVRVPLTECLRRPSF